MLNLIQKLVEHICNQSNIKSLILNKIISLFIIRFLSSYDSRFSIKEDLNRIQQLTACVDDMRVDYILGAVDSARKSFPCHLTRRKNADENGSLSGSNVGPSTSDVDTPVNGRLDEWTEEHVANVNGFVDDKVL